MPVCYHIPSYFSSSFLDEESASLSIDSESGYARPKKVLGKLVKEKMPPNTKKPQVKKEKRADKVNDIVDKKDNLKVLIDLLPTELIAINSGRLF